MRTFFNYQKHQETQQSFDELCPDIIKKCNFLCKCVNPSQKMSNIDVKRRWLNAMELLQSQEKVNWRDSLWKAKNNLDKLVEQRLECVSMLLDEISDFIFDSKINVDILRKCFLMQVI